MEYAGKAPKSNTTKCLYFCNAYDTVFGSKRSAICTKLFPAFDEA